MNIRENDWKEEKIVVLKIEFGGKMVGLVHSINGRCCPMSPLVFTYENMTPFSSFEMTLGPSFSVKDDGGLYVAQTFNGPTFF